MPTKPFPRVMLALAITLVLFVAMAAIVKYLVLPVLPPDWQVTLVWILAAAMGTVVTLAAVAGVAGYTFKDLLVAEDQPPTFTVSSSAISLSDGGITLTDGGFGLDSNLILSFQAKMCIHNSASPFSVRLQVASIAPPSLVRCLPEDLALKDVIVEVRHRKQPNWAAVDLGNPFIVEDGALHVEARAKIPFVVPRIEEAFGALAALKEMEVTLEAMLEGTGAKLAVPALTLDLSPVHARIESDVERKIPKYPVRSNQPVDTKQLLSALKRYWTGPDDSAVG